ncbi:M20 family metallopeptidase [Moritella sp. 24]|nr:M20 family metallopeptidase [Moritella sp. 24]
MMNIDFSDLKKLVEINSWTGNKQGVDLNRELMMAFLSPLGFENEVYHREHIGSHILFKSQHGENKPRVLLLGHLDTVFPPNTFESFSEDEEWIYGPGVCDMKGGNFVALSALRRIFADNGSVNHIDILLVSDEETGSDDSKYLTQELAKNYDVCFDFEAAGREHEVVVARKGVATFYIDLVGKAAHAGNHYVDGVNANLAAAKLLIALTELTDLAQGTTVNVGKIEGGIGANTISPTSHLAVEARFTSEEEKDRVLADIQHLSHESWVAGIEIKMSGGLQRGVMAANHQQTKLLARLADVLGYALKTEHRGGVSDANVTAAAGLVTLDGFGPYGDGDHTVHERASKASFERRIEEVYKILLSYQ